MIPRRPGPTTASKAEIRLFGRLETELGDEWTVLHSLGLAGHAVKRWAEADFVLVGPKGVYCIEVKGGRVAREGGTWRFTDGFGHVDEKKEGPFQQAAGEEAVLRRFLIKRRLDRTASGRAASGWGVAFPDIRFEADGPDIERQVVYDARDGSASMADYVRRLADHWYNRLSDIWGTPPADMSAVQVERVVEELRPDFDFRPRLADLVADAARDMTRLTAEQVKVLEGLAEAPRVVVKGSAGTGKTVLAVAECRRLAASGMRTLYVCFNVRLAAAVRPLLTPPSTRGAHLHELLRELLEAAHKLEDLPDADESYLFEVAMPEFAFDVAVGLADKDRYDAIVIDEAQDLLRTEYLAVLDALLVGGLEHGRWRAFLDPKQNAFGGAVASGTKTLEATGATPFVLTRNCRNTEPIVTATSLLSGVELEEALVTAGPRVEEIEYRDRRDEHRKLERVLNRLLGEGIAPHAIALLSHNRREKSCLAEGPLRIGAGIKDYPGNDRSIIFATVSSFKGLESDVVVLLDVDDLETAESCRSVYIGASRARTLLVVLRAQGTAEARTRLAEEFGYRLSHQGEPALPVGLI